MQPESEQSQSLDQNQPYNSVETVDPAPAVSTKKTSTWKIVIFVVVGIFAIGAVGVAIAYSQYMKENRAYKETESINYADWLQMSAAIKKAQEVLGKDSTANYFEFTDHFVRIGNATGEGVQVYDNEVTRDNSLTKNYNMRSDGIMLSDFRPSDYKSKYWSQLEKYGCMTLSKFVLQFTETDKQVIHLSCETRDKQLVNAIVGPDGEYLKAIDMRKDEDIESAISQLLSVVEPTSQATQFYISESAANDGVSFYLQTKSTTVARTAEYSERSSSDATRHGYFNVTNNDSVAAVEKLKTFPLASLSPTAIQKAYRQAQVECGEGSMITTLSLTDGSWVLMGGNLDTMCAVNYDMTGSKLGPSTTEAINAMRQLMP